MVSFFYWKSPISKEHITCPWVLLILAETSGRCTKNTPTFLSALSFLANENEMTRDLVPGEGQQRHK